MSMSRWWAVHRAGQVFQLFSDLAITEVEMIGTVLEEHPNRSALRDDPGDVRPEMARIVRALALAGDAERLARIARTDEIHRAAPLPDRRSR